MTQRTLTREREPRAQDSGGAFRGRGPFAPLTVWATGSPSPGPGTADRTQSHVQETSQRCRVACHFKLLGPFGAKFTATRHFFG